jgi:hypothetical protein
MPRNAIARALIANVPVVPPGEVEPLVTSAELAKILHVSQRTIMRWTTDGVIAPTVTLPSGGRRYRPSDVIAQLQEHERQRLERGE